MIQSPESILFEGQICQIIPKTPIHFKSVLQIAGDPVNAKILKWLNHGILIEGNVFLPWSNITSITPLVVAQHGI